MVIIIFIVSTIGFAFSIASLVMISKMSKRFDAALGSNTEKSLESTLVGHLQRVEEVDKNLKILKSSYDKLIVTNSFASQKIAVVRFNPFGDTGGDQSFSLAVLDAHDSGYVLTSIHGREGTRVYVKPVDYQSSKYTLSNEEKQALSLAVKRVPNIEGKEL